MTIIQKGELMGDLISRQAAIEHLKKRLYETALNNVTEHPYYEEMADNRVSVWLKEVPSAQPEQRYTEEELSVCAHGISLSLLSKRSAQHWQYDEDTATESKFLERLYEKVGADMRG